MRTLLSLFVFVMIACGQQARRPAGDAAGANLPAQSIGPNDLVSVSVYDAPELSRSIRVGADGYIRLPMLKQRIKAVGLQPVELETAISRAVTDEQILVDPFVTVTIAEYQSRPISIAGAVKAPLVFQAEGRTTLLEAISRAQGLSDSAGPEILVSRMQPGPDGTPAPAVQRIPVRGLIDEADQSLNVILAGGEEIRVPEAAKIFVMGNVKRPNAFSVKSYAGSTVLQILALCEGLAPFASKTAYIYRPDGAGIKKEIAVPLDKIMKRQSPDVVLIANDIFYVPDNTKKRLTITALDKIVSFGSAAGTAVIYTTR
jgi:polysaccharide biosynthesis/export protein